MPRTRIKFCGITRVVDALAAADAGADAIGMVFYPPAARRVSIARAREILDALPPFVTPVGLFVNQSAAEVIDTAGRLGLRTVQLHGDESPDMVDELRPLSVVKAVRTTAADLPAAVGKWRGVQVAGLLLETATGPEPGGTGVANDWEGLTAARASGAFEALPPLIAAGGLTVDTVGDVVRSLRPFAVDVSSGIEQHKGIKSVEKMLAFAAAVRAADN